MRFSAHTGIKTADAESLVITRIGSNAAGAHANCLTNLFGVTVAISDCRICKRSNGLAHDATTLGRMKSCTRTDFDRRTLLTGTTALGAAGLLPGRSFAQTGAANSATQPAATLPARGEFVVRGAQVLSMDDTIGDLPSGDVHVRDGSIVAVAANVDAPGAQVIDGKGMICMPGFVDTHWHHWTNVLRPLMRADNPKLTYFPVTAACGVALYAGGQLPKRAARPRPGPDRRHYYHAELGPQCAQSSARRRRNGRNARHRHSWPLRLW